MNCVFCRIIQRELPASFIYEDDKVAAFLDIHPINEGHVLIVPKRHEAQFSNLTGDEAGYLFQTGSRILKAIQDSEIKCEGANLFLSDGPVAGQDVLHSHLHIAPRFKGDGQRAGFCHSGPDQYPRVRLDQIAETIKSHLPKSNVPKIVNQPLLETKRLKLETFKETDLPDILTYASHPEVSKYLPWEAHKNITDSQNFLNFIMRSACSEQGKLFFIFAIRLKESGRVIGSIDFKNTNSFSGQIDYALGYEYWNKGIMSEAAEAIRDWAFLNLPEMLRLQSYCVPENRGSSRIMEKIGMSQEGLRRKVFVLKDRPVDLVYYAMLKDKFIANPEL